MRITQAKRPTSRGKLTGCLLFTQTIKPPRFNENGDVVRWYGITTDIHDEITRTVDQIIPDVCSSILLVENGGNQRGGINSQLNGIFTPAGTSCPACAYQ